MEEMNNPRRRRRPPKRTPTWIYIVIAVLAAALIVAAAVGIGLAAINSGDPTDSITTTEGRSMVALQLNGDSEIILEYGMKFEDPGAVGQWWREGDEDNRTDLDVTVEGTVDESKLGTYTITYTAAYEDVTDTKTRTVRVVDTTVPEIQLVTNPGSYVLPGETYQEEGYTAVDNYDGDITALVQRQEEGDTVIYTVSDSSGNQTQIVRQIVYYDPEAPELVLEGKNIVFITAGSKWNEPGYAASDNVDGDITKNVKISGSVDVQAPGTYYLTYQVSDKFGNTASVKRTVIVRNAELGEPNGKVIYLTFDDGPGKHTPELLQILQKYDVKVTFFVCSTGKLDLLDDIMQEGHAIGIHSNTHKYSQIYASDEAFFADMAAVSAAVEKYSGSKTTLMRFPGGSSNSISKKYNMGIMSRLTKAVQEQGYQYFDWHVDSNDAGGAKTAEEVAHNVISGIENSKRDNFVVLQHDIFKYSIEAVEQIIVWGLDNGYTFLPLDEDSPTCHHPVNN